MYWSEYCSHPQERFTSIRLGMCTLLLLTHTIYADAIIFDTTKLGKWLRAPINQPPVKNSANAWRQNEAAALFTTLKPTQLPVKQDGTGSTLTLCNLEFKMDTSSDSEIIIGAHFDKVQSGQGILDNWSGIVMLALLYETIKNKAPTLNHDLIFVAFAYEEDGLWGSKTYVQDRQDKGTLKSIKTMINIDCVSSGPIKIWKDGTSDDLLKIAIDCAATSGIGKIDCRTLGPEFKADAISFCKQSIPTISFDSLDTKTEKMIHTDSDDVALLDVSNFCKSAQYLYDFILTIDQKLIGEPLPK